MKTLITFLFAALTHSAVAQDSYTVRYTYDEQRRLTSATYDDGAGIDYAFDPAGNITSVMVTANQAPAPFVRVAPENGARVVTDSIAFAWTASADPEGMPLEYELHLEVASIDTTLSTSDTSMVVVLRVLPAEALEARWSVIASDGRMSTTASNGDGTFVVDRTARVGMEDTELPHEVTLHQNYPNPFNPVTTIRYSLPSPASVRLSVFDLLGRSVADLVHADFPAGHHQLSWDSTDMNGRQTPSGVYFYRLQAGDVVRVRTMLLVR